MNIYESNDSWIIEDQLNKEFVKKIKDLIEENLYTFLMSKDDCSSRGKNSEQYWIIKDNEVYCRNKKFEEIKYEYKNQVLNRIKKSKVLNDDISNSIDIKTSNCWTVIGEENSYHTLHRHHETYMNTISTILYLDVPDTNITNDPENNIFFILDLGIKKILCSNYKEPNIIHFNPEPGKILIFPSWIYHGTYPQTKGIRQTFNVEYFIAINNHNARNYTYA